MTGWSGNSEISIGCGRFSGRVVLDRVLIGRRVHNGAERPGKLFAANANMTVCKDGKYQGGSAIK